jgi:hypothetical protein
MAKVLTYNCKKIVIALGNRAVTGVADGSFVTIEPSGLTYFRRRFPLCRIRQLHKIWE